LTKELGTAELVDRLLKFFDGPEQREAQRFHVKRWASISATVMTNYRQRRPDLIISGLIKIAISNAAFNEIASAMPFGSVGYEAQPNEKCERPIWLAHDVVAKLRHLHSPGEDYSSVILRLAQDVGAER
jgi:hypothetical protein